MCIVYCVIYFISYYFIQQWNSLCLFKVDPFFSSMIWIEGTKKDLLSFLRLRFYIKMGFWSRFRRDAISENHIKYYNKITCEENDEKMRTSKWQRIIIMVWLRTFSTVLRIHEFYSFIYLFISSFFSYKFVSNATHRTEIINQTNMGKK